MGNKIQKRNSGVLGTRSSGNGSSTALATLKNERDYVAEEIQAEIYLLTTAETAMTIAVNHGNYCIDSVPEAAPFIHGFQRVTGVKIAQRLSRFGT
jgi:hypothetical protein